MTQTITAPARTRERLSTALRQLTGQRLAEVRVTRVQWPDGPRWVVMTLVADPSAPSGLREVPAQEPGLHHNIAALLREAFPQAWWDLAQDYDVQAGILGEHRVRVPACLVGDYL